MTGKGKTGKGKPPVTRPTPAPARPPLTADEIEQAKYVGSREHKAERWWGGLPGAFVDGEGVATRPGKQDTTICPLHTDAHRQQATRWVRDALAAGHYKFAMGDDRYPKWIWHRDSGQVWFGFCTNIGVGDYKGWSVDEEERREKFG